jgi:hypothetical protein
LLFSTKDSLTKKKSGLCQYFTFQRFFSSQACFIFHPIYSLTSAHFKDCLILSYSLRMAIPNQESAETGSCNGVILVAN